MIVGFSVLVVALNAIGRFNITEQHTYSSAVNRVAVFDDGGHLFAKNPLGVGAGNAGKIVTLFYLGEALGSNKVRFRGCGARTPRPVWNRIESGLMLRVIFYA